jgi:hypothetical protein
MALCVWLRRHSIACTRLLHEKQSRDQEDCKGQHLLMQQQMH